MPQPYLPGVTSPCMQPHPQPAPFPSNGNDRLVYPGPPGPALPLLAEFSHHVIFILIISKVDDISSPFENLPSARPLHPPHSTSTRATLQPAPSFNLPRTARHISPPLAHAPTDHPLAHPSSTIPGRNVSQPRPSSAIPDRNISHPCPKHHPLRHSTTHPSDLAVHHPHPPYAPPTDHPAHEKTVVIDR